VFHRRLSLDEWRPSMMVDLIDTDEAFIAIRERWEQLHRQDPEADYFLSWRWLAQVFRANPGHWRILAVRPERSPDGYVCFLPLRLKRRWSRSRSEYCTELEAAGRLSWGQYTGFVCAAEYQDEAMGALAAELQRQPWSRLRLEKCSASPSRLDAFSTHFEPADYKISYRQSTMNGGTVDNLVCPYIDLPETFDAYLDSAVSSNTRQKIRRFSRRIEQSDSLRISITQSADLSDGLEHLLALWLQRWAPVRGQAKAKRVAEKYRQILAQSAELDAVFLPVLWRNSVPLGALVNIIDREKGRMYFIAAGRDEKAADPFIGLMLHSFSVHWAIENGFKIYDFCHGNERYKYSLGAGDRRIENMTIRRRSHVPTGRLDPKQVA